MNTQLAIQNTQLENWALTIKDCKNSGLKVKEYCSQHGISKHAYYYWFKKVKASFYAGTAFVDITPYDNKDQESFSAETPENITDSPLSIEIRTSRATIDVPVSVSKDTLTAIIEVLCHAQ